MNSLLNIHLLAKDLLFVVTFHRSLQGNLRSQRPQIGNKGFDWQPGQDLPDRCKAGAGRKALV